MSVEGQHDSHESVDTTTTTATPPVEDAPARVRRLSNRLGYNSNAITVALLAELQVPALANQVLFPLVTDRVHHILRQITRQEAESQEAASRNGKRLRAGSSITAKPQSGATPSLRSPLAFLEFKVLMPGTPNGYKLYKDLTAAEHLSRAALHQRNAAPALHSARSHAWAAEQCQKHDVATLGDVPQDDLVTSLPEEGIRV